GGNGLLTGGMAFYEVYYSSDEQALAFGAIEPKFWANFCNAVQKPEWIPRHANISEQASLKADMSALFKSKTASEWDSLLSQADCCFTVITPTDQLIHDPQVKARQMAGVDEQGIPWMRSPIRLISDDSIKFGNAPQQGEHTQQILSEMGMASDEIDRLLETGIIRQYDT
ncbi:MAG: CoA transferase, partial [Chloroflexota bacterium]